MKCEQCQAELTDNGGPVAIMGWCNGACLRTWEEADPSRKDGWLSVVDLTPELARRLFATSGIELENSAGRVVIS